MEPDDLLCSRNARSRNALARANGTSRRASGWAGEKVARSGDCAGPLAKKSIKKAITRRPQLNQHGPHSKKERNKQPTDATRHEERSCCCSRMLAVYLDLLGEIVLEANLLDGVHLRVNPIDMRIDIFCHVF